MTITKLKKVSSLIAKHCSKDFTRVNTFNPHTNPYAEYNYWFSLTDKIADALRVQVTCPRIHSEQVAEPECLTVLLYLK